MIDLGLLITGFAVALSFRGRCGWLRALIIASWLLAVATSGGDKAGVVLSAALADLVKALAAVLLLAAGAERAEVRLVGLLSLALFPAHLAMSVTHGAPSWFLYASAVNAVFVAQCLIVGGWLDGLVRGADRFFAWLRLVPARSGGR